MGLSRLVCVHTSSGFVYEKFFVGNHLVCCILVLIGVLDFDLINCCRYGTVGDYIVDLRNLRIDLPLLSLESSRCS